VCTVDYETEEVEKEASAYRYTARRRRSKRRLAGTGTLRGEGGTNRGGGECAGVQYTTIKQRPTTGPTSRYAITVSKRWITSGAWSGITKRLVAIYGSPSFPGVARTTVDAPRCERWTCRDDQTGRRVRPGRRI